MNTKILKETRGAKLKEADAIFAASKKENRDVLTAAELASVKKLHDEIVDLQAQVEARDGQDAMLAKALADAGGPVKRERIMGEKDARRYSIMRAIDMVSNQRSLDGLEREVSDEEAKRTGRSAQGFFVPNEVFANREQRTNQVNVASDGGYLVGQDIAVDELVPLLRPSSMVMQLGARTLTGLKSELTIPRVTAGSTAYWLSETGTGTASSATLGQIQIKPRRLFAQAKYSKQFLAQSSISADSFVRDDILLTLGTELDRVAIQGTGAAQPLGILNMASGDLATAVTYGAAATFAKVVSHETNVGTANALGTPGTFAYLTTSATKGVWKTAVKVTNQAVFLWENGDIVNGYAARATNQFASTGTINQVIFGNFTQVLYSEFAGGMDVVVDPFSDAATGLVRITFQKLVDMVIRQGKAFSISTDSGAQ
jgi:hypothetical protein